MAVGWAREGDAEREAENDIAAEVQRARASLQGERRTTCVDCDEPIGKARLKALPHAQRCISCQEDYE